MIYSFLMKSIFGFSSQMTFHKRQFVTDSSQTTFFQLFPNSKFLLMIRDPRATVHSILSHQVTIPGYDLKVSCLLNKMSL
jgi:hypothetical protein